MFNIVWVNAAQKAAGMAALSSRVSTHHAYNWAEDVADAGEETIMTLAREDTGLMKASVGTETTAMGGVGVAKAGYGLAQAHPFYTKFQEFGTRHGITAMNSLLAAHTAMEVEARDGGTRMLGKIRAGWNTI